VRLDAHVDRANHETDAYRANEEPLVSGHNILLVGLSCCDPA
jgi:hypothetical protein